MRRLDCLLRQEYRHDVTQPGLDEFIVFLFDADGRKMAGVSGAEKSRGGHAGARRPLDGLCGNDVFTSVSRCARRVSGCERHGTRPGRCLSDYDLAVVSGIRGCLFADGLHHVHHGESGRRIYAVAGGLLLEPLRQRSSRHGGSVNCRRRDVHSVSDELEREASASYVLASLVARRHRRTNRYNGNNGSGRRTDFHSPGPGVNASRLRNRMRSALRSRSRIMRRK